MSNKHFSIQIDELIDCSAIGHFIAYMRYAEGTTINEDMLFCKPIRRRATAQELFKIVDDFMKEKCVKLSDCVGSMHGCSSCNGRK
jgi:hypothetical protein